MSIPSATTPYVGLNLTATGILGPLVLLGPENLGFVCFDGAFTSLSFSVQASRNAADTQNANGDLPQWFNVDANPYYQNTGIVSYPVTITGPAAFLIPNIMFCNGMQVTVSAVTGTYNCRFGPGSFLASMPNPPPTVLANIQTALEILVGYVAMGIEGGKQPNFELCRDANGVFKSFQGGKIQ